MKLIEIVKLLASTNQRMFSIADLAKLINSANENNLYKTSGRLLKNGIIKRLARGLYYVASKAPDKFEVANYLYSPSYVSLESALNRYGVIDQMPYTITSVTPRKSKRKTSGGTEFEYVHLSPKYFSGYVRDHDILIASREKALIDLLYLISKKVRRFNLDNINFAEIDKDELNSYSKSLAFLPLANLMKGLGL